MSWAAIVFVAVGLLSLAGALFDWDWFMTHRRARLFTHLFGGRTNARIFYVLFGAACLVFGVLVLLGVVNLN
jgi:hypothetical protein